MGETNDSTDYPQAMGDLLEALAQYLYDHYDDDKFPSRDPDAGIGDCEPWESAGKRKREHWFEEADRLMRHFAELYLSNF